MGTPVVKNLEDWVAEAKLTELYKTSAESTIPTLMLERSEVNAKYTEKQARVYVAYRNLCAVLPVKYREGLLRVVNMSSDYTLAIEGYARKQAIEAEGKRVSGDQQAEKKKGLLGMLGIG